MHTNHNTMPSCLDSLIGQDNGCSSTDGRLYLKDIGITDKFIAGLLAKHNEGIDDWMNERRRIATEYVTRDVVNHISHTFKPATLIDNARLGNWPDVESLKSTDAGYTHGIMIEVCSPASNTKLNITGLEFYGETNGTVTATVYDLADGSVVATLTTDAVAGQISYFEDVDVVVQNLRGKKRIWITTDQTQFYQAQMSVGCAACKPTCYKRGNGLLEANSVRFLTTDKKIYMNRTTAANTGGLSATASVSCDQLAFLCEMKSQMALPLLYCLGREIHTTALYNYDRWGIQNLRKEDIEARRDELEALYSKVMDGLIKNIGTPNDVHCFACDRAVYPGVILP